MELFDTHCHMHELVRKQTPVYDKWREDGVERTPDGVIAAAREADVRYMLCVGTSLADSELAVEFVQNRDEIWSTIGIHPHEAKDHLDAEAKKRFASLLDPQITQLDAGQGGSEKRTEPYTKYGEEVSELTTKSSAKSSGGASGSARRQAAAVRKIVAVGECGLDYYYNHSPKEAQIEVLKFQIELALKHNLPMSFHVREAFDDFWPIYDSYGTKIRGVLHSFTDNEKHLEEALKRGLYIGVNGISTFASSAAKRVIYRTIPQQSLLLETDAPFLTPIPFRGKVCEPKHVRVTAEFLSNLRDEKLETLAAATTRNAKELFQL